MKRLSVQVGILLMVCGFILPLSLRAQQTPFFSHYYLNPYLINPAMAGQSKETRAFLLYRLQWVGMPGAPQTQALTIDGPLTETRFGLGLTAVNDITNFMRRSSAMVTGSYAVPPATDHELTFGLSFGVLRNQIDFDKVRGNTSDAGLLLNSDNRTVVDGLREIIKLDPSVIELIELGEGFIATRNNRHDNWAVRKADETPYNTSYKALAFFVYF